MGFWGEYVVARSGRSLSELEPLSAGVCRDGDEGCVGVPRAHGDGWQTVVVRHGLPGHTPQTLRTLVERTGRPALVVYICDSDTGFVQGWSDGAGLFETWYTPELAADYEVPNDICYEDETGMPGTAYQAAWDAAHSRIRDEMPQRAREACTWAVAAGWRPEPAKVLEILSADCIEFAEHHFFELLRAMGLPTADA
ncbi:hypothetical protein ACFZBU_39295 [Embleya sp. NPDC008237]|uniref:hypothetical protein n=1 Tax=Embleya sp. NPDC008237 TaxID=3363978 RepID=UPI0036E9B4DD